MSVEIKYFSDILCVWAYISQVRIGAIKEKFGDGVRIEHRFCSVFGDTAAKIDTTWKDKGGYAGFNAHLRQSAGKVSAYRSPSGPLAEDETRELDECTSLLESDSARRTRSCGA